VDFVSCRRRRCRNLRHVLFRHSLVRLHGHNSATVPPELLSDSPHQIPAKSIQPLKQSVPANFLREHMAIEHHSRLNNQIRLILAHLALIRISEATDAWKSAGNWVTDHRQKFMRQGRRSGSLVSDSRPCFRLLLLAGTLLIELRDPLKDHCHTGITFSHME
jgi:hypothetical protein